MTREEMEAEVFEFETDREKRLFRYGAYLASQTTDPLMKEKLATIMAGHRTDH